MDRDCLDLYQLQEAVKEGLGELFPERLWVKAEIAAMKARAGSHCYLELSQSGPSGIIAKAKAIVWANNWRLVSASFIEETGGPIMEGMQVLMQVQVNYSEVYGLSLIVTEIDPAFTVGEAELQKRKTIERLEKEGLMDLQKFLELPLLPYKLAVISASDAAGYGDFQKHLKDNPYGFVVETQLFPALMQGQDCPASIIAALDTILLQEEAYDAVMIMRGGGARLDLACFDDYDLAAHIAQFPLPVMTAVGHEQDFHVCDMVAFEYVKTPTALADRILECYEMEDEHISGFVSRLRLAFSSKISSMESQVNLLENRILSADPRAILSRGYTLVLDSKGKVARKAAEFKEGDGLSVMFPDGKLNCKVM